MTFAPNAAPHCLTSGSLDSKKCRNQEGPREEPSVHRVEEAGLVGTRRDGPLDVLRVVMDLLEVPRVPVPVKILRRAVEERDELWEPSGNVCAGEVVDGEVLRGDDALRFPGHLVGEQGGEGVLQHLPRRRGAHLLHEVPAHDDAVAALLLLRADLHVEPPAAVRLELRGVEDLEGDGVAVDRLRHRGRLVGQGRLLLRQRAYVHRGRLDFHLARVHQRLLVLHELLEAPVLELPRHLLRLLGGCRAVRALAHAAAVHGRLPDALLASVLVPGREAAELVDPLLAHRKQLLLARLREVHALVVVAQLGAADEEGPQGVPQVLGEAEVLGPHLGVEDEERGGLGVVGHVREDKTELVDDLHLLKAGQRVGRVRDRRRGDLGGGPQGDRAQAAAAARGAREGHGLGVARAAASDRQHAQAAAPLAGDRLLREGEVVEQLVQNLCAADAVRERQVAGGGLHVVVDELVRPGAVLPLVREP
mmetsp:Transcript_42313/g.111935  ORF Transcript_42313/g.111935 Transcript_42313/m.111935 type:complete len:477 (+) Transcript_42313:79-1509(+)